MRGKSFLLLVLSVWFCLYGVSNAFAAGLEGELQAKLREARSVARAATAKLAGGSRIADEGARLRDIADEVRIIHLLLEGRFKERSDGVAALGGPAVERHRVMEARYQQVVADFLALVDALSDDDALTPAALKPLLNLIDSILPPRQRPILGSLPYSHLNYPVREPLAEPLVVPAYRGGDRPADAADTQGTPEAPITPEIAEVAKSLDWNPIRIYEWVQENIETEWYWGSMKGAEETLRQRSGNDADQAALLIALLRSAGFPARYVRGVIEFFPGIEQARRLTGLDDPLKIAAFLQKAGIPFEPVMGGGGIVNFRIEHIWVEAEVPYANYRGAVIDNMGKVWTPLDTHMKPPGYNWNTPKDFDAAFDPAALRDDYLFQPRTETPLEYLQDAFGQYLAGNFSDATYQDHLRTRTLIAEPLGLLPGSLQFNPLAVIGEYTELPADLRHRVTFTAATPDGGELFAITLDATGLSNRMVSLSYEPETVQDQRIIHSYGGLDNTPSYLVRLRPVLKVDGERLVVGRDGLPMGADYTLTIGLTSPNGRQEVASHHIIGNLAVLGIVSQQAVQPAELPLEEKDAERLLLEAALSYIDNWNRAEEELAAFLKVTIARPLPTVVTVGGVIDVDYLFDIPHGFEWKGVFIDAGLRRIETVTAPGQEARGREFMRLSSLQGSILENRLFEDAFGVASISTAKLLAMAPESLATLLTIDSSNVDAVLPPLNLAENIEADIRNAVHQGFSVTLPDAEIGYKNWTGIGYIKENPGTGEAGYMLSGMIAGGMTAEEWADQSLSSLFKNSYSEPPNQDPDAAARIFMIPVSNWQNGIVGQETEEALAVLVVDLDGRPVAGAEVTFTALSTGAHFDGAATVRVATESNGIAKARPILGTSTKNNPSYRTNQGDANVTQVGVNLFNASVTGRYGTLSLPRPFEVYGWPDIPVEMVKLLGDGNRSIANNPAGTLSVLVVDQYENPVSNVPVIFQAESATSMASGTGLPQGYRGITFYDRNECVSEYPLFGDCSTSPSITKLSAYSGVGVETILGNTVNTRYEVSAKTPGVPDEIFTLYSSGNWYEGDYIPPQLFISHLIPVNNRGEKVNAAKAGEQLKAPLVATMFLSTSDYTMEPKTCKECDSSTGECSEYECWTIKGSGLVKTERINDGTVSFTPVSGGGSAGSTENLGDGSYQATYKTGSIPSLNRIEAIGEAAVTVPVVYAGIKDYTSEERPLRTVTLQSGQSGLFHRTTGELILNTPDKLLYGVYGVDVTSEVSPKVLCLGEGNMARDDLTVTYTILPDGNPPAGYDALSAEVDLSSATLSGEEQWEGYQIGSVLNGSGTAVFSYGTEFDLRKNYYVQPVLNRGGEIEIHGEKIPLNIVRVDLDIDSDNNAGFKADGTHNDPQRDAIEDQAEDYAGAPGKLVRPNLLDVDGDKVPGFADGINVHDNEGEGASAPFVPLLLEIGGNVDPAKARIRFVYSASDPAVIEKTTDAEGRDIYTPVDGHLRLWAKDGSQSRNVASLKGGGDFVKPGDLYSLADLGQKTEDGCWRLWIEGIKDTATPEEGRIKIEIDLEGTGQTYFDGDSVQTTVRNFALIPDYNHNRCIDEEDRKRALAGDTFYFWINDDDDIDELEGSDIPGADEKDGENNVVDGMRDLTDFFPVWLDIKDLIAMFPPDRYVYQLSSQDNALNFTYSHLDYESSGMYLYDVDTANKFVGRAIEGIVSGGTVINKEGLQYISQNDGKGVYLFEGKAKTSAPLALEVRDIGNNLIYRQELSLSLDGVEQMFRHKNLTRVLAAMQEFPEYRVPGHTIPSQGREDRLESDDFSNKQHFSGFDAQNDDVDIVFVHGYNVNAQAARGAQAEVFKRLYWSGSKARFWGITWYGYESQSDSIIPCLGTRALNYHVNVRHAFNTGRLLKQFIDGPGPKNATFIAHSLGNMVQSTAIKSGLSYARYLMVNAAVPEEAYMPESFYEGDNWATNTRPLMYHPEWRYPHELREEEGYRPFLWASEWHKLFSDERANLTWRGFFEKVNTDHQKVYAFYAPTDEAFIPFNWDPFVNPPDGETAQSAVNIDDVPGVEDAMQNWSCSDPEKVGTHAFNFQELLKGRMWKIVNADSTYGGWGFNRDLGDGYYSCTEPEFWYESKFCEFVSPTDANVIDQTVLKSKPLFKKNPDKDWFYTDGSVSISEQEQVELLANEIPALTFATGHAGAINAFTDIRDIDIRQKYLFKYPGAPWVQERKAYEWRHNDLYFVAYPFLYRMYDDWARLIKGDPLQ